MFQSKQKAEGRTHKLQNISFAFKKLMDIPTVRMHSAPSSNTNNSIPPIHSPVLRKRKHSFNITRKRKVPLQLQIGVQSLNRQVTLKFANAEGCNKKLSCGKYSKSKYSSPSINENATTLYNKILSSNEFLITKAYTLQDIRSLRNSVNIETQSTHSPTLSKTCYGSNNHTSSDYCAKIKKYQKERYFLNKGKHQERLNKANNWFTTKVSELQPWETERNEENGFPSE